MQIDAQELIDRHSDHIGRLTTQTMLLEIELKHARARIAELEATNE